MTATASKRTHRGAGGGYRESRSGSVEAAGPAVSRLDSAVADWDRACDNARSDAAFLRELELALREFMGRPTPLTEAAALAGQAGTCRILLKREDLAHTGSAAATDVLIQGMLARRMGRRRLIASTTTGRTGVAAAAVAARLGLDCTVHIGACDEVTARAQIAAMAMLGACVTVAGAGHGDRSQADQNAVSDWLCDVSDGQLLLTDSGRHFAAPMIAAEGGYLIAQETRHQVAAITGGPPVAVASTADLGCGQFFLRAFAEQPAIDLYSFVPDTPSAPEQDARRCSVQLNRMQVSVISRDRALQALALLGSSEGIIASIDSAFALAGALEAGRSYRPDDALVVLLTGRGEQDMAQLSHYFGLDR